MFWQRFLGGGGPGGAARGRLHRRRGRRQPHRAEVRRRTRRGKKPAIRWSTISTGTRSTAWPTGGAAVAETAALPPVVAAALALDAWEQIAPLQHSPWLGRLLIPALLRARGKTKAHLVCLAIGLRAVPRDRRRAVDQTARLIAFVDALAAAAEAGLKEHERWAAARTLLARKLAGRRATSRLPALVDYVMSSPDRLGRDDCGRTPHHPARRAKSGGGLGLREATGRGRYRAWGVI